MHKNLSPVSVLEKWSKEIEQDLARRTVDAMQSTAELHSISSTQNQMVGMLSDLKAASVRRDIEQKDLSMKLASQEVTITKRDDKIAFLERSLQHANLKLVYLKTPEPPTRKRGFEEMAGAAAVATANSTVADARRPLESDDESGTSDESGIRRTVFIHSSPSEAACKRQPVHLALQDKTKTKSSAKQSSKNLEDILVKLRNEKRLVANDFTQTSIRAEDVSKQSKLKYCFELAMAATTLEERKALVESKGEEAIKKAAETITNSCTNKMYIFEGTTTDAEKRNVKSRTGVTYIGFGNRVVAYKKNLAKLQGKSSQDNWQKEPLVMESEVVVVESRPPGGTPEGNTSINTFFGRKTNSNN